MANINATGTDRLVTRDSLPSAGTTTNRTLILKQIAQLQKSEAAIGQKILALGNDFSTMPQRIELEHEMHGIDEQIKALQSLLLQENADRKVQSVQDLPEKPAEGTGAAKESGRRDVTVGTVIDVKA